MMYTTNMTDEEVKCILRQKRKRELLKRRLIALAVALVLAAGGGFLTGRAMGNRAYAKEMSKIVSVTEDKPIINAAVSQLGNKGGEPFWSWFGFQNREEWCACFVSWCEDQCGYIKDDTAPRFALVSDGADWFVLRDQWRLMGETPEPGDLIFFDWDQDGGRDHVGIVSAVDGDKVFTIEGNSSDLCRRKRYFVDDPVIYGYGVIKTKK